jgi:hypothetical protein
VDDVIPYIWFARFKIMCDTEEDISGDLAAAAKVYEDLERYDAICDNFQHAWCKFELSCAQFFEHLDQFYRIKLVRPILPNLETNIEKLRQKNCAPFAEALAVLETVHHRVIKGTDLFQYITKSVYRNMTENKLYICIYPTSMFMSVPNVKLLTDKCTSVSDALRKEHDEYIRFEQDIQLILLTYLKRNSLSADSRAHIPRLFDILSALMSANVKLENRIDAGFMSTKGEGTIDVVFKPKPMNCRTYDLMKTMANTLHSARQELQFAITEVVGSTKKQSESTSSTPSQN